MFQLRQAPTHASLTLLKAKSISHFSRNPGHGREEAWAHLTK